MNSPDYLKVDSQFFSGGGEMGELMRKKDWSKTSLGSVEFWPQSLKTIVNVCLNSRFPIMILWGEDLINIYNDSLKPILGEEKHPFALGAPAREIWTEIWDIVEPMLLSVYDEGKSPWSEHRLLLLQRNGYTEECYFTFSFSPIHNESGEVKGVFTAVTETTREVISARYLNTMRDLSTILTLETNELDIYNRSLRVMIKNEKDFPFAILYKIEEDGHRAVRVASTDSVPASPQEISFGRGDPDPWMIHNVVESNREFTLDDLSAFDQLPKGAWKESAKKVLLLPIGQRGKSFPFAVLIIGLNPHRKPDHEALGFYRLLADQIAGEIVELRNYERERRRAEVQTPDLPPPYLDEIQSPKEMAESIPIQSPEGTAEVKPPRILVADDNPDILAYIKKILKDTFQVDTASNGKVALTKIFESPPDLVIADIMMPARAGIDLLNELKSNLRTSGIPVILLSARSGEDAKIEGYKTGADDYLVKPFSAKELVARVNTQIRSRHERTHAEAFLRDVFEQAPVPICFLKGADFRIEQANSFMLDFWGKTADEVMFKPMAAVFPEMVDQGFLALLKDVYQKGERFQAEETPLSIMRNGKLDHRYVSFVYEPFKDPAGNVTAIVSVGYDVTGLVLGKKSAQQHAHEFELQVSSRTAELRSKNEELLLKAFELEQFTFLASHDLQEPLRKILTFSGLMMHNIQDHKVVEKYVNKIVSSVSRMSGLIQSLLDYTRLSQSNVLFVPVNLNTILKSVLDDLELLISEKNCTVRAAELPVVIGDPRQLGQLFLNLIHNAIKFCKATPVLDVRWQVVGEKEKTEIGLSPSSDFIRLDFADNGIGFESHFSVKVFEMFQRLHSTADYPGMGIGLSLCKKITENHHGMISAESILGTGSCFHVYLPAGLPA